VMVNTTVWMVPMKATIAVCIYDLEFTTVSNVE
jgi:hypothetical protein